MTPLSREKPRFKKGQRKDDVMQAAARFQKEPSRRSGLDWRGSGKGACAPDGALWQQHDPLDRLLQRQRELLLFLLPG